jgi:hypothetical protein
MSKTYTYFAIPFDKIPKPPQPTPYTVWFASWSLVKPQLGSNTRLTGGDTPPPPFVIGMTSEKLAQGAMLIGKGPKNASPPPLPSPTITSATDYLASVRRWLESGKGPQTCSYFSIPFALVPTQPAYTVWFATWSLVRPVADTFAPFSIGATDGALPDGATLIARIGKDPPPPPPATPSPDTSLASYSAWLMGRGA